MSAIPDVQFDYPSCPVCDETLSLDGDTWECSKVRTDVVPRRHARRVMERPLAAGSSSTAEGTDE